jgi:hypothetical protein
MMFGSRHARSTRELYQSGGTEPATNRGRSGRRQAGCSRLRQGFGAQGGPADSREARPARLRDRRRYGAPQALGASHEFASINART